MYRRLTRATRPFSNTCFRHKNVVKSQIHTQHSRSFTSDIFTPTEEHGQLRQVVRSFTADEVEPQALKFDREEKFNRDLFTKLGELGLLGITADPDHGGSGMDAVAACIAHEELSYSDPAFCLSYLAHSMLFVNNLSQNGSSDQKERYLQPACTGEHLCGMGMSESGSGTDALAMGTTAKKAADGESFILNGSKMWITNGYDGDKLGDTFLIYARSGNSGKHSNDFSQFLVHNSFEGFSLGQKILDKCGMRASPTAELLFEDCVVPTENLVGTEGKALLCMMRNLEIERVTLAAMSLGIARRCIDVMNDYAKQRKAFGFTLNHFGQIQQYITQSYADYMAARCYLYNTASNLDIGQWGQQLDSDGAKLFAVQMGKNVADRSIQVLGANGYIGDYAVERLWRDSKLLEIGGGTLEAHQKNMIKALASNDLLP